MDSPAQQQDFASHCPYLRIRMDHLHQLSQPRLFHLCVVIEQRDILAIGGLDAEVVGPAVMIDVLPDEPHPRKDLLQERCSPIRRGVVHHDDLNFILRIINRPQCRQAFLQMVLAVVGGNHNAHAGQLAVRQVRELGSEFCYGS